MTDISKTARISRDPGFIAALDQSGGSTPGALAEYGIPKDAYTNDDEMFALMHDMRVRVITSAPFHANKIIGAILFEKTMDGQANGKPVPSYLWEDCRIVPFLKIDKGLSPEEHGVQLMKPIGGLDTLLSRAAGLGVYGTKERSVIHLPDPQGIAAVVAQQYAVAEQVIGHGLVPILEPEVLIRSPDKAAAEALLLQELKAGLERLAGDAPIILKVTIPEVPDLYADLIAHPRVQRVVALSGGYSLSEACDKLRQNHGMIASFSRALLDGLHASQSQSEFDTTLSATVDAIYDASVHKMAEGAHDIRSVR